MLREETFGTLEKFTLPVRARVAPGRPYAIGLRLGERAARELAAPGELVVADSTSVNLYKVLSAALAIARAAAPFGDFTDAMRKQADQIVVTSRFRFTRNEGFEATAETSARP